MGLFAGVSNNKYHSPISQLYTYSFLPFYSLIPLRSIYLKTKSFHFLFFFFFSNRVIVLLLLCSFYSFYSRSRSSHLTYKSFRPCLCNYFVAFRNFYVVCCTFQQFYFIFIFILRRESICLKFFNILRVCSSSFEHQDSLFDELFLSSQSYSSKSSKFNSFLQEMHGTSCFNHLYWLCILNCMERHVSLLSKAFPICRTHHKHINTLYIETRFLALLNRIRLLIGLSVLYASILSSFIYYFSFFTPNYNWFFCIL